MGRALRQAGLILVLTCGAALACAGPAAATPVFLTPINVSAPGQDAFEPQVVVDPSGNEHHVWTESDGTNTRIRYRIRDQAGTFGTVETISAGGQDASQPDIDVDPNGDVVAVWTRSDGSNLRVEAASRPANGSWGAVQVVSAAGQNADKPRVSVDDAGKAVAIWISYDVGTSSTGRIQSAVRSPGGSFGSVQTISDQGEVTITPQVDSGPAADANAVAIWARSDGAKLRVQSARRHDVVGFPRPKVASPLRLSLVIGFNSCGGSPNRTHGPPLASPSCNPPVRSSGPLTVGTPDANTFSAPANSVGFVRYSVLGGDATQPPDEADVAITVSITDVRNSSGGTDYTGRLLVTAPLTVTDNDNSTETPEPGTTEAFPFQFPVQCAATVSTTIGGQCDVTTTYDALVPGAVIERQRAVWALGQVQVKDAGPNGTGYAACPPTCGDGDETVFMRQGIFVP
jgi:hypothetical protein